MSQIKKVAVIGAGTMGSGIASHLANTGISVDLLDVASGDGDRSRVAKKAIERQLKSRPPAFFHVDCAANITAGNIEDDLHLIAEADWIAEAVVERLEIKESLYKAIDRHRKPGTPVSSNTSTIPLSLLTRNMPESFRRDFCITHFFNPVRHMRLLEIVAGPETRPEVIELLTQCCDETLGKGVVACKDTPGFLGNRVGVYAIQVAIIEAMRMGLTVEEADAIMGRPIGWPKTGVFRLYDLIGLDLMLDVLKSMRNIVPEDDAFFDVAAEILLIRKLVDEGYTGNKGLGGFYRRQKAGGNVRLESIDLQTGDYRPTQKPTSPAIDVVAEHGLRGLVEHDSKHGQFAWRVLSQTLSYAASLVPDVSDELVPIDEAMKLGFSWGHGPFEMIDQLGTEWFANRLESEGSSASAILKSANGRPFYRNRDGQLQHLAITGEYKNVQRAPGVVRLTDSKKTSEPLLHNGAASLWDVGDGVACFEFHSKANALLPETMQLLDEAIEVAQDGFKALVIYNDAPHFSVGVNIQQLLDNANAGNWSAIETMLVEFQQTCKKLKYSTIPVIGAPSGMSLGGGFEVLLHCDSLVAHTNNVAGLVETQVGLIPSGGGCKEMLFRWSQHLSYSIELSAKVFKIIGPATTAASPMEAEPFLFMLARDRSIMNGDRILAAANSRALAMSLEYQPPESKSITAAGPAGVDAIEQVLEDWNERGFLAPHDTVVGRQLAKVLCGETAGERLTEDRLYDLEREAFMMLVQTPASLARIAHTLNTGKPLRN